MNPYLRWAVLLLVVGGLAYYYRKGSLKQKLLTTKSSLEKTDFIVPTKKPKQRKPKKAPEVKTTGGNPTPTPKAQPQALATASHDDGGEGMSNLEFAKQFSKTREGNAISSGASKKDTPASKPAPKSTPKPASRPVTRGSTSASSMTGTDADEDVSFGESSVAKPAGDVSDMLEAPAPGASVLRLTGSVDNEKKSNKNKKSEGPKTVETKKQRQQRIKKENNKRMVQEAEAQRRALLEKQLHTAREHERQEAAKSKPPTSNAWTANGATNGVQKPVSVPVQLLDTFESGNQDTTPKKRENNAAPASKNWTEGLPSEEEQMRVFLNPAGNNEESEWTTVPSAKNKKQRRANNTGGAMSDTSSSDIQVVKPAPAPVRQSAPAVQEVVWSVESHPLDSDWAA